MSRLLESLKRAEQERSALSGRTQSGKAGRAEPPSAEPEPGYFWTSLLLLMVVCAVIFGGFVLVQDRLYGITAAEWMARTGAAIARHAADWP